LVFNRLNVTGEYAYTVKVYTRFSKGLTNISDLAWFILKIYLEFCSYNKLKFRYNINIYS